jgi:hypothetical protein
MFVRKTCRIHFRTLSTNEVNPRSKASYVDLDSSAWDSFESIAFQDRLAIKFRARHNWNGLILDCMEARAVMVGIKMSNTKFHTYPLE